MATIRTRTNSAGKPRYQAVVKIKGHPVVRETFGRKGDALAWAERVEAHIKIHGHAPESVLVSATLADAIRAYSRDVLPTLAPKTQRGYSSPLKQWNERLGAYSIASITPAVIGEVYREECARTSGGTGKRYLDILSSVLRHAVQELRWISHNPCRDVRRRPGSPERVRFLSDDERRRLLKACRESSDPRLYPLVLLALSTGLRRSECISLKWRDIDLRSATAMVRVKGGKKRTVSLHGEILDMLKRRSKTPHISGYVFATLDGKVVFPIHSWNAARDASVEDFRFHDLRHTFASYALMAGVTLLELQHLLGHRSLAATQRYAHMAREHGEGLTRRVVESWQA